MKKTCVKCGVEKSIEGFNKKKSHKDGYASYCKECNKAYCKEYYQLNRTSDVERIEIEEELLLTLYWGNQYNCREISEIFDCGISTIHYKMNKCDIQKRTNSDSQKGKKLSDITRKKISESKKGILPIDNGHKLDCNCGVCNMMKGISHWNEESKRKFSKARSGKNHPQWLDGASMRGYGFGFNDELKEKIKERDGFVCQECGIPENELKYVLCVHHIDYDKNNHNESNLISLCRSCHSQTNFKRDDWTKYYRRVVL